MEFFTSAILVILTTTTIGFFLWWRRYVKNYWEKQGVPVETTNVAFALPKLLYRPIHDLLLESYKKYGRIYGAFEFRNPVLTVCEPELLRDILVKDFHVFPYRRDFESGDEIMDNVITALKGEDWKRVRTVITPAFTSKRMRQMSHIINECSVSLVKSMEKYADTGEPIDVMSMFGSFSLDVIALSNFATKINSLEDPDNEFVTNVKQGLFKRSKINIVIFFLLPSWMMKILGISLLPSPVFFKNLVLQVIRERKNSGKKYNDMLQLLLDAREELEKEKSKEILDADTLEDESDHFGSVTNKELSQRSKYKKMTEEELIAQCIIFFLVGYHTVASTLAFMAYLLALNPECQEKLAKEVDEAFDKHKELTYDVIREMKYLDCVLSETLRMYPALTRSERTAVADYKLGNTGITIQKGSIVGFNIQAMHLDPEFFPEPEKFMPERFFSENVTHPQYAYLPFGAGPRNCLGMRFAIMEAKLCIIHVLRQFKIKKAETTRIPLKFQTASGLLSVSDLPLLIEKRR